MRLTVPDTMKYFCVSESVAYYLQKYIVYRKRKIFFGKQRFDELIEVLKKHCNEKYLVPVSASHKDEIPKKLTKIKIKYTKAVLYRTVNSDLSDLVSTDYDMMIFYSPSGVKSLLKNFPDFEQKDMKIASFGPATAKAVKEAGLRLDLQAPMPKAPSMTMAVDLYIKKLNGKKKAVEVAEEEDS